MKRRSRRQLIEANDGLRAMVADYYTLQAQRDLALARVAELEQQPPYLDLAAIEARAESASPGPWDVHDHVHLELSCRCFGHYDKPTGYLIDNGHMLDCDDIAATRSSGDGRDRDSCGNGPLLPYADAVFAAHAREDVPALLALVRQLQSTICEVPDVA